MKPVFVYLFLFLASAANVSAQTSTSTMLTRQQLRDSLAVASEQLSYHPDSLDLRLSNGSMRTMNTTMC